MLRPWSFNLVVNRRTATSVARQIVHAMIEDIRRGRLPTGTALPGSRELADRLGVNRKTVIDAYRELAVQGWLSGESRRGTFVAENLPTFEPGQARDGSLPGVSADPFFHAAGKPSNLVVDLPPRGMLAFDDGTPDVRQVPVELLARAYRDGLRSALRHRRTTYEDPRGSEHLRAVIAEMLSLERGLAAKAHNLCLTRGSQMAIFAVAKTLVTAGDTVVVERLSYPPARETFRNAGAAIEAVPVDDQGLDVDELEAICRRRRVRAVYVTPHHQYPTTVSLPPERRMRLMVLAAQFGFAIVEDDYDHEFHFRHQPMLPLAAFDGGGHVIYIGSLSKLLSPSLRLGYISAPTRFVDRIAGEIMMIDRQGDPALEEALATFIEAGELHRHTRKMRRIYSERRERFAQCLATEMGDRVEFSVPDGGLAFWVRFADVDMDIMRACSQTHLVHCQSPRPFEANGAEVHALRLGFASLDLDEIVTATKRLGAGLRASLG